jgi:thioredoxin-related protein
MMRTFTLITLACILSVSAACAQEHAPAETVTSPKEVHATTRHDENPKPFDITRDAMADVDAALTRAEARGTKALIVMGANWCHDSRGLAGRLERPEFQTLVANQYELVYVSAGDKKGQNNQNRNISERFGVEKIKGTPTVFIVDPDGEVLNTESTGYWKRADSIPVDMSYAYLEFYAKK